MRLRETLLGLAVLGLVLGGVFWSRGRSAPLAVSSGSAGAGEELPDVTRNDATVEIGDATVVLSVAPRPPVAFAAHRWRVRAVTHGEPQAIERGRLSFEMVMPMGDHRYQLVPAPGGWWEAEVVLPSCPSGKRRWFATFDGVVAGVPRRARVRVDLAPSRTQPPQ